MRGGRWSVAEDGATTLARVAKTLYEWAGGEEALDFLYQRGAWAGVSPDRPGLILLDVNLPKVSGQNVLRQIKDDPELLSIPVVMLTTSDRDDEVGTAYRAGANSWVTKPVQFTEFMDKVKTVKLYWVLTNRIPQ